MADRGIIFSAPMVRALLAGRKSQTRRLLKPAPKEGTNYGDIEPHPRYDGEWFQWIAGERGPSFTVPFAVGDRLYVREAWTVRGIYLDVVEVGYRASERSSYTEYVEQWPVESAVAGKGRWPEWPKYGPSIHMPRWASRLWLEVKDVRVERVASIIEEDAKAEGVEQLIIGTARNPFKMGYAAAFSQLWDNLHPKPGETWADNPWVVAVSFEVHRGNIDAQ